MIETFLQPLPHGITLSCRAAGASGRPVLLFLHGFPEAAFVWDALLEHFAQPEHGGYRCVAPNLRGFERSTSPQDVAAYRPKHLVQDIIALIDLETGGSDARLACLVAHDWGGAVAWNLTNQAATRLQRLAIINSPHPGTFLRELQHNPSQQFASAYMNFLVRDDAEALLSANDYERLWGFFRSGLGASGALPPWLNATVQDQYRAVWQHGLHGGCNYYRASPLRPPRHDDPGAAAVSLPAQMLTITVPTMVLWGLDDVALPPALLEGLDEYVPQLELHRIPGASHWIVHEQPALVREKLSQFLLQPR